MFNIGGRTGGGVVPFIGTIDNVKIEGFVPEPSTVALLITGLVGLVCYAWRKRK